MAQHTCMLCEAVCGLEVEVEDGRVVSIRGDEHDPFSRGHICPKAAAIKDVMEDPDRIREPMRRVGDRWEPISWDEALDEAGRRLAEVQRAHGRNSLGLYLGNPTVHSYSALFAAAIAVRALNTRNRFSATSVDQLPHMLASLEMLGHQVLLPVPDLDRTDHLLILGGNPLASNGSIMTAPDVAARLKAIRARGGKIVVIDPRRTETAAIADEHVFIRPAGDAFLLLGMLHVIFAEELAKPGQNAKIAGISDGLTELRSIAARFPPDKVSARAGIPADTIRRLARELAAARTAAVYGRVGLCTQEFGGLAAWLLLAINAVTGNLDREGGMMLASPAVDLAAITGRVKDRGHYGVWKSRVRGLPEFGGELPAAVLAEEIETPGEGQIRALVTFAGNPVLSTPDGRRLDRALGKLDYMVSIDIYRNETTRHANLILPTSFGFERDHFDAAFYIISIRNAARYAKALVAPPPGVRQDFQILMDLALSLMKHGGGKRDRKTPLALRAARLAGSRRILDLALRTGAYGGGLRGLVGLGDGLSLRALERKPHGVDLGPLVPRLPAALQTKSRRIQLAPALYLGDLDRLDAAIAGDRRPAGGLALIGRRHLRSNNSWLHNAERLVKGPARCTLLMHPDDAAARNLSDGQLVRVRSSASAVTVALSLTQDIAPGVVSLPHGWGHDRPGVQLRVAQAHAGASVNDLVESRVDPLSGVATLNGLEVTVEPAQTVRPDAETPAAPPSA